MLYCFSLKQTRRICRCGVALLVFGLFHGQGLAQAQDEYLKSLEGEAATLELDKKTRASASQDSPNTGGGGDGATKGGAGGIAGLAPGLSIEQFEQVLEKHYIGSYLFYKRLSDSQKQQVYSAYQANPDPASIRDTILKVRKQ